MPAAPLRAAPARTVLSSDELESAPLVDHPLTGRATAKARNLSPLAAILQRHREGRSTVEEAVMDLYHGSLSVARADEACRLLWGERLPLASLAEQARAIADRVAVWEARPLATPQIYVFLFSIALKQKDEAGSRVFRLLAAAGVGSDGTRELLGLQPDTSGTPASWDALLSGLARRGLSGTELFVGENDPELRAAVRSHFRGVPQQVCLAHLRREVQAIVPVGFVRPVMDAFERLRQAEKSEAAEMMLQLAVQLAEQGAPVASELLASSVPCQLVWRDFPLRHQGRLQDVESCRKALREFREWIRLIGPIADERALALLAAVRLRQVSRQWAQRRFMPAARA